MQDSINLPPVYELVPVARGDALEEAVGLAIGGADEGTLVWRRAPRTHGEITDLDCALILRPDQGLDNAAQLIYVAAVSLGSALSEAVQSLVELRFRWPNQVRIGLENHALLALRWPEDRSTNVARRVAWLVLGVRLEGALGAIADDASATDPRGIANKLLEGFGRHFLADINRWAEDGFDRTRKRWLSRADGIGESTRIAIGDSVAQGIFETIDDQGRLVLRSSDGARQYASVEDFFRAGH